MGISDILQTWNSTRLGWLKDCPRKLQLAGVFGWQTKHNSFALRFGAEYQYALEIYDRLVAGGSSHNDAVRDVVRTALERTWERAEAPVGGGPTQSSGGRDNGSTPGENTPVPAEGKPWGPGPDDREPNRSRETLIRSIVWYLDHFEADPAKTIILDSGKPAVELSFQMEAPFGPASGGPNYIFSGHLDRVVEYAGEQFIVDHKTTVKTINSTYFRQFEPDNQMSLYTLAAQVVFNSPVKGVMIDAAQVAVGFTAFVRGVTYRTEGQLNEWLADAKYWIGEAEKFALAGYYPQNDRSCFLCQFKSICSKDPSVRDIFLNGDFIKAPHDPLEIRG